VCRTSDFVEASRRLRALRGDGASTLASEAPFISGGRGIGLRSRCARRDGTNVAIAAKTTAIRLPGTIYTAAAEIEKSGGKALPIACDIRDEDAVRAAVTATVSAFGGIDVLVNNASAISLTGTLATPMKRFDLMVGVNVRGTFLCSQACAPHLEASAAAGRNPHILTLSPPLNLDPRWFRDHVAYTIAKYGMSMCVLGMAEEFRAAGIAVNALRLRSVIATSAIAMIPGPPARCSGCARRRSWRMPRMRFSSAMRGRPPATSSSTMKCSPPPASPTSRAYAGTGQSVAARSLSRLAISRVVVDDPSVLTRGA
jgi:citronellol/citronellal dehydrogenase